MKEFETIVGQAKALLRRLLGDDAAELTTTRIDEGGIDGDLCATVRAGSVMAVVWPTAEKLKYLKELAQVSARAQAAAATREAAASVSFVRQQQQRRQQRRRVCLALSNVVLAACCCRSRPSSCCLWSTHCGRCGQAHTPVHAHGVHACGEPAFARARLLGMQWRESAQAAPTPQ